MKRQFIGMLLLAGLVAVVPAHATLVPAGDTLIYSNLGNGYSGTLYGLTSSQALAVAFTPSFQVNFADAQLPLDGDGSSTAINVYLESDGGGHPGTILDTLVEQQALSNSGSIVTFDCSACLQLSAGTTYWIVATQPSAVTGWFSNASGISGGFVYDTNGSATGPWIASSFTQAGLEVDGDAPEPASFALMGTALAGLVLVHFRKRPKARRAG